MARTKQGVEISLADVHVARGSIYHQAGGVGRRILLRTGSQPLQDDFPNDALNRSAIDLWRHFTHHTDRY